MARIPAQYAASPRSLAPKAIAARANGVRAEPSITRWFTDSVAADASPTASPTISPIFESINGES